VAFEIEQYYQLPAETDPDVTPEAAEEAVADLLQESVRTHLAADVEVGVALSGGLDSSLIALIARQAIAGPLKTFTFGIDTDHPDVTTARQIIRNIDCEHSEIIFTFEEYLAAIPETLMARENPSGTLGLNLYLLSSKIIENVKVCLIGEGADELFGGYTEFLFPEKQLALWSSRCRQMLDAGVRVPASMQALADRVACQTRKDDLSTLFEINMGDQLAQRHLASVDASSMAWGVEMRVPFLDLDLVEYVSRLPMEVRMAMGSLASPKPLLKQVAANMFGEAVTPAITRRKLPFPDSSRNHHRRFRELCAALLPPEYVTTHPYREFLRAAHGLLLIDLYEEIFVRRRGRCPSSFDMKAFVSERAA
jgi:asparagine synthase (glutamine-hydrolysing)